MSKHLITMGIEVDTDYDDPKTFATDINQAIDNNEQVTVVVAGNAYLIECKSIDAKLRDL